MFRGEQMMGLSGPIVLEEKASHRSVVNQSEYELRDAVLVDFPGGGERREIYLGTIAAGGSVAIDEKQPGAIPDKVQGYDGPDPAPLLEALRRTWENRPENAGETRLVAWTSQPIGGQTFEPALDRHRGLTAVLVHLRYGNPPAPDGPKYYSLTARGRGIAQSETAEPAESEGVSSTTDQPAGVGRNQARARGQIPRRRGSARGL